MSEALKTKTKIVAVVALALFAIVLNIATYNPKVDAMEHDARVCNSYQGEVVCYHP